MKSETNNPSDVGKCCKEMFQLWLRKYSTATWDQLIQALREVDETTLATKIEGMLRDAASGGMSLSARVGQRHLVGLTIAI